MDKIEFYDLLPKFRKRWVHGEEITFSVQRFNRKYENKSLEEQKSGLEYHDQKQTLTNQYWWDHFSQVPKVNPGWYTGALAICGKFQGDIVKWICWDADDAAEFQTIIEIRRWLESKGFEPVLEHSRGGRGHLWLFCDDLDWDLADRFQKYVASVIGCTTGEVYPFGSRRGAVIRVIGGWHWWTKGVSPCEFKGQTSADAKDIMKMVISADLASKERILPLIPSKPREKPQPKIKPYTPFVYTPRNLPLPFDNMSPKLNTLAHNCQAVRELLIGIKEKKLLDLRGIDYHNAGLKISGIALAADIEDRTDENIKWFKWATEEYRTRSAKGHGWNDRPQTKAKYLDDWRPLVPSCKTLENDFGLCGGCPYYGLPSLINIRKFWSDESEHVQKIKIKDTNLVSLEDIRTKTFPAVRKRVAELLRTGGMADILLASPQGAGKSQWTDHLTNDIITSNIASSNLAARLADESRNVLIVVPTAKLAVEHKERIEALGQHAHILSSHERIFDTKGENIRKLTFGCPSRDDIQYYIKLGASSKFYKDKYCKGCPHFQDCPYPRQYVEASLPENRVVIMMHAHFQIPEVLRQLQSNKKFDVMIVDESFIDSLITVLKPLEVEYELLRNTGFKWAGDIANWMQFGGIPSAKIHPKMSELEEVKMLFEDNNLDYERLRKFHAAYLDKTELDPVVGVMIFHPLPNIPIRIFTDATPPIQMLEIFLNNYNIEIFGLGEVVDIREYHPENAVYTVLDSSSSKTSLGMASNEDDYTERFYDILNCIGESSLSIHAEDKVLVTTYISHIEEAIRYLREKYPELDVGTELTRRICVSHMQIGTNDFADRTVQHLLAAVNLDGKDYSEFRYRLLLIKNYFNRQMNRPEVNNIYPHDVRGYAKDYVPITVVEPDGVFQYPKHFTVRPRYDLDRLIYKYMVGKSQQASRIRFNPVWINGAWRMPVRKKLYKWVNQPHEGLLTTHTTTFEEISTKLLT